MFVVVRVWNCPEHVRGYLRRFLSEPVSNMFVGTCSLKVSDNLWDRVSNSEEFLRALMVRSTSETEQGFETFAVNMDYTFHLEFLDDFAVFGRKHL